MSNARAREVVEGWQYQGKDESIAYTLDVSAVGDDPTSVSVDVFAHGDLDTSVKSTVMPSGSPSVAANVITLPALTALTAGTNYRVEVKFTIGGNVLEHFFNVSGQR